MIFKLIYTILQAFSDASYLDRLRMNFLYKEKDRYCGGLS